jgi:hypothetical protein
MNERIKELMEQTGVPLSMPFDKWCEKFAELIVRECAQFTDSDIRKFILKHFGVEE